MTLAIPSRRGFLLGAGALLAAPAIVRVSALMPVSVLKPSEPGIFIEGFDAYGRPVFEQLVPSENGGYVSVGQVRKVAGFLWRF